MDWNTYPIQLPQQSQTYIVSVNRPYQETDLTFNYIAYYNVDTNKWHKYDGFIDDGIGEVITDKIVGWANLTTYLG